jgi:hypothetical protein
MRDDGGLAVATRARRPTSLFERGADAAVGGFPHDRPTSFLIGTCASPSTTEVTGDTILQERPAANCGAEDGTSDGFASQFSELHPSRDVTRTTQAELEPTDQTGCVRA